MLNPKTNFIDNINTFENFQNELSNLALNSKTEVGNANQNPNNSTNNVSLKNNIDIKPQNKISQKNMIKDNKIQQNSPNYDKMDIDEEDIVKKESASKGDLSKDSNRENNLSNLSNLKNNNHHNCFNYTGNGNSKINANNIKEKESIEDADHDDDEKIHDYKKFEVPCSNHERKMNLRNKKPINYMISFIDT